MSIIRKNKLSLFCLVLFLVIYSCSFSSNKSTQCNKWIKTFFRMPLKERLNQFSNYSIEDQYDIFICGNQVIHPPALYLARPFAMQGKSIVGFLKVKLSQAEDDLTIRDIILVFEEMSKCKTYNVVDDKDLFQLINDSIVKIKDKDWKKIAERSLEAIEKS